MPKRKSRPVKKFPIGVLDLTASTETEGACNVPVISKQSKSPTQNDELKLLLNQAAFYVPLWKKDDKQTSTSAAGISHYVPIGEFTLTLCGGEKIRLSEVTELWLYVANRTDGQHFLYQEQLNGSLVVAELHYIVELSSRSAGHYLSSLAVGISDTMSRSCIRLQFTVDQFGKEVTVQILMDNKYIYDMEKYTSYSCIKNKWLQCIQAGLALAGHSDTPDVTEDKISEPELPALPSFHHNVNELFKAVKQKTYLTNEIAPQLDVDLEPTSVTACDPTSLSKRLLLGKLRPYQREAVRWMIANEKGLCASGYANDICKLFMPLPGSSLFMNTDSGAITAHQPHLTIRPGGILADEMGLGKTVEVLTCMVCHPREDLPSSSPLPASAHVVGVVQPPRIMNHKHVVTVYKVSKTGGLVSYRQTVKGDRLVMAAGKPAMKVKKPAKAVDEPTVTGVNPATTGGKPAMTVDKPAMTGDKPAMTGDKPAMTVDQPAMAGDKPAMTVDKPAMTGATPALTGQSIISNETLVLTNDAVGDNSDLIFENSSYPSNAIVIEGVTPFVTSSRPAAMDDVEPLVTCVAAESKTTCMAPEKSHITSTSLPNVNGAYCSQTLAAENGAHSLLTLNSTGSSVSCGSKTSPDDLTVEAENQCTGANCSDEVIEQPNTSSVCITGLPTRPSPSNINSEDLNSKKAPVLAEKPKLCPKFECTCGILSRDKVIVECSLCYLRQHAQCVGYDVTDPYRGAYKCPHCHTISEPIKSGATLIIAPASIRHQWREEIIKHIGASHLKILEYEGVTSKTYIQPMTLSRQDIVITTYDVLKAELRATNVPHSNSHVGRQLRKPKRFMALPSPLTAVEWWRVCLDEAQMVESVFTRTAEMALKLHAVNRWCVTGTPINSGVDDLFGLFLFLGVAPFSSRIVWDALVYRPYCFGLSNNLYTILRHVMWRTCKADVRDQLGLPPQTEVMHEVMFSSVEEVFYRQQYSACKTRCLKILDKYRNKEARLDSLSRHALSEVLQSLQSMRQACCYPEVSREKGRLATAPKLTLTMDELLTHLTQKVRVQTEDAYRCIVAALNGQAACHVIWKEYDKAIEKYWEVLHPSVPEYSVIETDTLQRIHANHNLREVLTKMTTHSSKQIDLDELERDAEQLANKYMGKTTTAVVSAQNRHEEINVKVYAHPLMDMETLHDGAAIVWWVELFKNSLDSLLRGSDTEADLLYHIHNRVYQSHNTTHFTSIQSLDGIMYKLYTDWIKLVESHTAAKEAILELSALTVDADVVEAVANCCLRPGNETTPTKCMYCEAEDLLKKNEFILYDYNHISMVGSEEVRTGNRKDSVMELAFKAIISYMRHSLASNVHLKDYVTMAADHMTLFGQMKLQFKLLRILWRLQKDQIAAIDEMSMGKTRFRLRHSWEPENVKSAEVVEQYEVADLYEKQINDLAAGKADFAAATRQHNYLKHIGSLPMSDSEGNKELCPICQQSLGHSWVVLSCCHSFCMDCIQVLFRGRSTLDLALFTRRSIRCAVCRQDTRRQHLSYVSSGRAVNLANEGIKVKGNYSSKVMEVVRCLKVIERDEPNSKALVFSSWTSLLEVIARALHENNITYQDLSGKSGKNYEKKLNNFRCSAGIEALLLLISSGANGLNLTEATHVLLLEPLLHAGREAQAIGRVHRIGQTKPTFVHKFIVRHTIEQQIHSIMSSLPSSLTTDGLVEEMPFTIADLAAMFESSV